MLDNLSNGRVNCLNLLNKTASNSIYSFKSNFFYCFQFWNDVRWITYMEIICCESDKAVSFIERVSYKGTKCKFELI